MRETLQKYPLVRAIEVKLSQGAKPGAGGILPQSKITPEIASIRGIPRDRDCISPAAHGEFSNAKPCLPSVVFRRRSAIRIGVRPESRPKARG